MARTPLMSFLKRATRRAAFEARGEQGLLTRRDVMVGATAAAATAVLPLPARAAQARIAIVGAGLAGLTAAYELKKKGVLADVFEGNTRVGGRCFTARGIFAEQQIAEHGGEFIDTDHHPIRDLAAELGLTLVDVLAAVPKGDIPLYRFNNMPYDLAKATRDWKPIYGLVQKQSKAIGDFNYKHSTPAAKQFDAMTISDWVKGTIPGGRQSQLGQLIENAFTEENAIDADQQSALCAIPTLADDPRDEFDLYYTDSDQRFHTIGGNDQIPTLLAQDIGTQLQMEMTLIAIAQLGDGTFRLTFARDTGTFSRVYDRVILAIPFSVMRAAVDFGKAGFSALKIQSINTLTYGTSVKFQLQFLRRRWNEVGCDGEIRLPAQGFQTTWDVTRGQPGRKGIMNFWSGGTQAMIAGEIDNATLANLVMREAAPIIPGLHPLWNGLMIKNAWQQNPWSLGSYSAYQPGYQTTLVGIEKVPEGNCFFAGEHTESQNGFLNAGVASGQRAAREVLASL